MGGGDGCSALLGRAAQPVCARRSIASIYSNRAMCAIKIGEFSSAVGNAGTVPPPPVHHSPRCTIPPGAPFPRCRFVSSIGARGGLSVRAARSGTA